jgi:hypothetical protein
MSGGTLFEAITILVGNLEFIDRHRINRVSFTRERKLSFKTIVFTILKLLTKSLHIECEYIESNTGQIAPSKQAFSNGRYKMKHTGFKEITEVTVSHYYKDNKAGLWKGYRMIAGDGSTIRLPESESVEKEFKRHKSNQYDSNAPILGKVSVFMDVCCEMILDVQLRSYEVDERTMAAEQLPLVTQKLRQAGQNLQLYIYDRGYVSKEAIAQHLKLGVDFVFRIKRGHYVHIWKEANNGKVDFESRIEGNVVRVVVIELETGEKEILITSLRDKKKFSLEEMNKVYQLRWRVEECYKKLKVISELENFSGVKLEAVLQDFWAHVALCNILRAFIRDKEEPWSPETLPEWRLNFSVLLGATRHYLYDALLGRGSLENFEALFNRVAARARVKVRPGRSYSRDGVGKPKRQHIYRRVC